MQSLYHAGCVGLVLINLAGLSATVQMCSRQSWPVARMLGVLGVTSVLFFVEHFIGLGSLNWAWPITSAWSAFVLRRRRDDLISLAKGECWFLLGFIYALLWRWKFPDIAGSSEKLMDLTLIAAYLPGGTLPPIDPWFPPYPLDFYYTFQHYSSALMGRVFAFPAGITYNISFCIMTALVTACVGAALGAIGLKKKMRVLVVATLLIGGTGITPFVHAIKSNVRLSDSMRVVGHAISVERADRTIGKQLVAWSGSPDKDSINLPAESFSYLVSLGDHHPPMGGFVLLATALLGLVYSGTSGGAAILGASLPLCIAVNTWSLPLQGLLVTAGFVYRLYFEQRFVWRWFIFGLLLAGICVFPFLGYFAQRAAGYDTVFRFVESDIRTPFIAGFLQLWPFLLIPVFSLFAPKEESRTKWVALFWIFLMLIAEVIYLDDIYSGKYERFNTTLKWLPWIWFGTIATCGALNLRSKNAWSRRGTVLILLVLCSYAFDLASAYMKDSPTRGQLHGTGWMRKEQGWQSVHEYLRTQPPGIAIQRLQNKAYTPSPAIPIHAGHHALLGWPSHEKLWRANQADVEIRRVQIGKFYRGEQEDTLAWLISMNVDYVIVLPGDIATPELFKEIHAAIGSRYAWRPLTWDRKGHAGVWQKLP